MIKWKKIIFNRSNKITKIDNIKSFDDFSQEVESGGYKTNQNYSGKEKFFDHYFKIERYAIWSKYLKDNLNPNEKILSIASGRAINELDLISNKHNITCSDLEIPECYEASKNLFGNFDYIKLNILEDKTRNKFQCIFCISALYIFSNSQLEKIFYNIREMLEKDGTLIIDFGGAEDHVFSFIFHEIFLLAEAYLVFFFSKIINKKIGFEIDYNHGYRRKNKEIIEIAKKVGLKFIEVKEYDYLSELQRSIVIRKLVEFFPFSKKFFSLFGRKIPYIRFFKFRKE